MLQKRRTLKSRSMCGKMFTHLCFPHMDFDQINLAPSVELTWLDRCPVKVLYAYQLWVLPAVDMEDVEIGSALSALSFTPHSASFMSTGGDGQQSSCAGDHRPVHLQGPPRVQGPGIRVTIRSITAAPSWSWPSVHSGNIHNNHLDTPTAGREPGSTLSSNLWPCPAITTSASATLSGVLLPQTRRHAATAETIGARIMSRLCPPCNVSRVWGASIENEKGMQTASFLCLSFRRVDLKWI